ncbi:MAG: CapA family protein [Kouleothrix sp.]|nr:CapA family protein [Kouleothrix sp.]
MMGCAAPASPAPTATPIPADRQVDQRQWRELYRRPGWDGGAAADLRATGDVMLGRTIAEIAARRGLGYPLGQAQPLLDGDLAVGNLESPLTDRREPLRAGPYRLPAPASLAGRLASAGFDALSLANNHALDVGPDGLRDAAETLRAAGIAPLGVAAGAGAREPTILRAGGLRVALLAFNAVPDPEDQPDEGLGWGRAWLDDDALAAVRQARASADAVVVLAHWGVEYAPEPSARQRDWAARLVAAGADLVLGAHPHVLQPIAPVASGGRAGVVAYSLGNFVFDQAFSRETSSGAVLRVLLDSQGVALVAAAPVEIVAGEPRPLAPDTPAAQEILRPLAGGSVLSAWSWDGQTAKALDVPPGTRLSERPARVLADLRGDGRPLLATLDGQGLAELHDGNGVGAPVVWRNEDPSWRVTRIDAGDLDDDGRIEVVLLLWEPDAGGQPRSHPFLVGWRGGRYRVVWGGGATAVPIQDLAAGDLDGDGRYELVVLEGGQAPGDSAESVSIWRWGGWSFQREWRSPPGRYGGLALRDLDGDGRPDILAH